MSSLVEKIKNEILILDGGTGTLLQAAGIKPGEAPELWNLTHPDEVTAIHKAYFDAGSDIVSTNTFGVNSIKYSENEIEEIVSAAVKNVREAIKTSNSIKEKFVALDIGPSGKMLVPFGELSFEEAVSAFSSTIKAGVKAGVDLIFIETMTSSLETKAALLAAKENSSLPVFVSNAYGIDGRLMSGTSPAAMVAMLEGMGADAIGVNCSFGPDALSPIVEEYLKYASVPVILKPNAGLPKDCCGKAVYDVSPDDFAIQVSALISKGVRIAGGCCGTTPEYIKALTAKIKDCPLSPLCKKDFSIISSRTDALLFGDIPLLIGERLNPTGKKRLKQALAEHDIGFIQNEALMQYEAGAHILDVNVGTPEIDEKTVLCDVVSNIQSVCSLPLQIDSSDPVALENALRVYDGKAMINSVNGKENSMETVFPIAKKYGGLVVALTLDENGIPSSPEGRFAIAEKILNRAKQYGFGTKDIIFDTLTMAVSADNSAPSVTLKAMKLIEEKLGCKTVLGVSNVSFGLPERDIITSTFFTLALENGLSAAIMNPFSEKMNNAYRSFLALKGIDKGCQNYIANLSSSQPKESTTVSDNTKDISNISLIKTIINGQTNESKRITASLLQSEKPIDIINTCIIPALDQVGKEYEEKRIYLPNLLMSAESAGAAFEVIKQYNISSGEVQAEKKKATIVLATVFGDIHDIGKNIVKLLLENYGFNVIDLGKDVPPERVLEAVLKHNASIVGLSALMTTTVPSMENTIKLIKANVPTCKIVVGGAVLTKEYAELIGADMYAADAMETVRYSESLCAKP